MIHCNAIQVLTYELQEVGLKKGEFSKTLVAKMSEEPQPPLGGMFGKEHFRHLVDIEIPMEEDIDVPEGSQAQKIPISVKNLVILVLLISFMS